MNLRYEINSDNAVLVYVDGADVPSIFQDGDYDKGEVPFKSKASAKAWADAYVDSILNPPAPVVADAPAEPAPTE